MNDDQRLWWIRGMKANGLENEDPGAGGHWQELRSWKLKRKSRPHTSDSRCSMPITRVSRAKETDREGRDRDRNALLTQLARTLNRNFRAESAGVRN